MLVIGSKVADAKLDQKLLRCPMSGFGNQFRWLTLALSKRVGVPPSLLIPKATYYLIDAVVFYFSSGSLRNPVLHPEIGVVL